MNAAEECRAIAESARRLAKLAENGNVGTIHSYKSGGKQYQYKEEGPQPYLDKAEQMEALAECHERYGDRCYKEVDLYHDALRQRRADHVEYGQPRSVSRGKEKRTSRRKK